MILSELLADLEGWPGDYEVVLVGDVSGEEAPLHTHALHVDLGERQVRIVYPERNGNE